MPPSRSLLNQPINLETNNALYNHTSSTSIVHGLPSGAAVLGDKSGTGRYIGTATGSGPSGSSNANYGYNGIGVTYSHPVAYNSAPTLLVSGGQGQGAQCLGDIIMCEKNSTTFQVSCHGYSGYTGSCQFNYLSIGS